MSPFGVKRMRQILSVFGRFDRDQCKTIKLMKTHNNVRRLDSVRCTFAQFWNGVEGQLKTCLEPPWANRSHEPLNANEYLIDNYLISLKVFICDPIAMHEHWCIFKYAFDVKLNAFACAHATNNESFSFRVYFLRILAVVRHSIYVNCNYDFSADLICNCWVIHEPHFRKQIK